MGGIRAYAFIELMTMCTCVFIDIGVSYISIYLLVKFSFFCAHVVMSQIIAILRLPDLRATSSGHINSDGNELEN